jgi:tetratricopeptide (TPR) repeat protein
MGTRLQKMRAIFRRRSVWLGLVALVLVGTGAAYYVRRERAIDLHKERADAALDRLDLPGATAHLRDYLAARPDSAEGQFLLARTLRRDGKFEQVEHHLNEAKRLGWSAEAVRQEAFLLTLQRSGVRDRPVNELMAMVRDRNPDRTVLEALYRGDLAIKNWDRAGLWLHIWLENYPDDWAPRLWQAELLERFLKYDRARADYLRVLQLRPDHPRALLGVGTCALANRADYTEAEEYLGRYLATDPDHAAARVGVARCRYGRGDLAGAREWVVQVLEKNENYPAAALLLGTIEAEAGRDAEAARWLRVAQAGGADPMAVNYQLAQVLRGLGQTAEADAALQRFSELRAAHWAAEAATRAAEREPKNAGLQYEVGRCYVALGESDAAVGWFVQALKIDPDHRASHAALAEYYGRQPDPGAAARAEFQRAHARGEKPAP